MAGERYCNFQITLLKQIGIWPADRKSKALHFFQKFFLCIQMLSLFLISLALILGALFSEDLKNISSSVDMVTLTISAMYKAWFVSSHIDKFRNLIEFMGRKFISVICNQNGDVISVAEKCKNCSLYTFLLCFSGALVMLLYSIVPVLENEAYLKNINSTEELFRKMKFPLLTWIPFNVYWSPMFEFVYLVHSFVLFASANIYLVNDSFFFMMIYLISIQMKMLNEMLKNVGNTKLDYMDDNCELLTKIENKSLEQEISALEKNNVRPMINEANGSTVNLRVTEIKKIDRIKAEKEIHLKIRKCIIFHSDLLKMIMTIEKLFRSMILADVLHAIISLSFALHETGVTDSIYNRIKMYSFLVVCIVHQLGNSYFGQILLNAQEMIFEAAYNLHWCDASIQTKKCLILILARSNKFAILNGGKMYYLRFESFIMFMRTLFSYYMVLRQTSSE